MNIDWFSLILGSLISLLIGYIFFKASERKKKILVLYKSKLLQFKNHPQITILYNGDTVDSITNSRILLINSGNEEVRKNDFKDSFKIELPEKAKILSLNIIGSTKGIEPIIKYDKNILYIEFNHLNPKNHIIIDLIHEGHIEWNESLILGTSVIVGASDEALCYKYSDHEEYPHAQKNIFSAVAGTIVLAFLALLYPIYMYNEFSKNHIQSGIDYFLHLLVLLMIIPFFAMVKMSIMNFSKNLITIQVFNTVHKDLFDKFLDKES